MAKQSEFKVYKSQIGKGFGGSKFVGHPKKKRPFSSKHFMHVVLKSSRCMGNRSMLRPQNKILVDRLVNKFAVKFFVEVKQFANVGNHLHLLIKSPNRHQYTSFIRTLTAQIPRKLLKLSKSNPAQDSFWDYRPYTKLIANGLKPFQTILRYFSKNHKQARHRVEGFDVYFVDSA